MKKREVASLACRFFSLFYALGMLAGLPQFIRFVFQQPGALALARWHLLIRSILVIVLGILPFILWRRAGRVATCVVSGFEASANEGPGSLKDLYGFAFSILGLDVIIEAIQESGVLFLRLVYSRRYQYQFFDFAFRVLGELSPRERLVSWIVSMALGVGLFLGARWLASLLWKERKADLARDPRSTA